MTLLLRLAHVAAVDLTGREIRARARAVIKRGTCRLMGGHWRVLHTTRNHVALRCVGCGHTSPGWEVGPRSR
jgi:hypothetical protein